MPQSKLTPEDLYNIYLDTSPKIDQFAEQLWTNTLSNPSSDLYLGQSYLEGLKRASIDLKAIGFMFDPNHNPEPLVQRYLEERGGKFITWLSNSGKKEFADLLIDAYTSTGSYEEFRKMFRDKYPYTQSFKPLQIWVTENNIAANHSSLYIYDQYKIPGFRTILGPSPCPICMTENMYDHRANESVPPYHVYAWKYDDLSYVLLKNKGWTLIKDVELGDIAFSLNPDTKEIEESEVVDTFVNLFEGNLVHIHNFNSDILVTDTHKIICNDRHFRDGPLKFKEAKDFTINDRIPRTGIWKGKNVEKVKIGSLEIDIVTFCKFMGYFLSEGSLVRDHQIFIAQIDGWKKDIMLKDLQKLPANVTNVKMGINVYGRDLNEYCKQFGKSYEKFVPCIVKELTPEFINIFLNAFLLGDGTLRTYDHKKMIMQDKQVKTKPTRHWYTTSKKLVDDISELLIKIGNRPSIMLNRPAGSFRDMGDHSFYSKYDVIEINECKRKYLVGRRTQKDFIPYKGKTVGITLENNHTVFNMRNGKVAVIGNCQCTTQPILIIENKRNPNAWKQYMTSKEKDRFYSNYAKFNPRAKAEPLNYTEKDMKKAIDNILERKEQSKK